MQRTPKELRALLKEEAPKLEQQYEDLSNAISATPEDDPEATAAIARIGEKLNALFEQERTLPPTPENEQGETPIERSDAERAADIAELDEIKQEVDALIALSGGLV